MNSRRATEFDVFLSHNTSEKVCVQELANHLKDRDLSVWFDEWELVPGRPWREALETIVSTTRVAAVIVGKDGFGPWQNRETSGYFSEFVDRDSPVIPVLLPGAPDNVELPLFLKQFTWVDLRDGITVEGVDRLEWGITGRKPSRTNSLPRLGSQYSDGQLLHLMWDYLDGPLQDAFSLAYNKKRRKGKNRVSTRDLFQALVRIDDPTVSRLLHSLPDGAMPEPPEVDVPIDDTVLHEEPLLSDCIAESLSIFETVKTKTRKVTSADLFVDIGKHGHGPSVKCLREHGVSAQVFNEKIGTLGMVVLDRE